MTTISIDSLRTIRVFRLSDDSPAPLNDPDTSYLSSIPELSSAHPAVRADSWQQLQSTPSRSPIAPGISVPRTPTPRSSRLHNDTPTPAATTPGSWRERRRQGEMVARPLNVPRVRVNPPDGVGSISPDMPSSKRSDSSRATTATDSQGSGGSRSISRQGHGDAQPVNTDVLIQFPPLARVASHSNQCDGTFEEREEVIPTPRRQTCLEKLCGNLRSIPSKLNLVEKKVPRDVEGGDKSPDNPPPAARSARSLAATQDKTKWWSITSRRSKQKSGPGRNGRRSASSSLRALFKSTDSTSDSTARRGLTRFDDNRNSRSFVSPTPEHETDSPDEDPFAPTTESEVAQEGGN